MIEFKNNKDVKLFASLHPILIMIFADMYTYALEKYNIELVVTDTVSTKMRDKMLKRKSPAHLQKRAIDVRTKNVPAPVLMDIMDYVNENPKYEKYKYVSQSGEKRLAYFHFGTAEHLHIAIHSRYSL